MDQIKSFIIIFNKDFKVAFANKALIRFSGYSAPAFDSLTFWNLFKSHLSELDLTINLFNNPSSENSTTFKDVFIKKNGLEAPVKCLLNTFKYQDEQFVICTFREISEEREMVNRLAESERRYSTLLNNLPGMVYQCHNNSDWTMIHVSDGSKKLLGYSPQDFIDGKIKYAEIVHPNDREFLWTSVQEKLHKNTPMGIVYRIITAAGKEKWVVEHCAGVSLKNGRFQYIEGFITDVTQQKRMEDKLHRENEFLRMKMKKSSFNLGNIVGQSDAMQKVYHKIMQAADSNVPVVLFGESGTGKELAAEAIHDLSRNVNKNFIAVNCGAIPDNLIESEFFGYKKGAFTGANKDKMGVMDRASEGTLFLDEIGEINLSMQIKLLRALDGAGYTPVGGSEIKRPNFRMICATNRNLLDMVKNGQLREDFFYRIHVLPIELPPLRERKEDIPLLITHFIKQFAGSVKKYLLPLNILNELQSYSWPGNVRELKNIIHRYIATGKIDFISKINNGDFGTIMGEDTLLKDVLFQDLRTTMAEKEKEVILASLRANKWHRGKTAENLGIGYRTLLRKIKEYDITLA